MGVEVESAKAACNSVPTFGVFSCAAVVSAIGRHGSFLFITMCECVHTVRTYAYAYGYGCACRTHACAFFNICILPWIRGETRMLLTCSSSPLSRKNG